MAQPELIITAISGETEIGPVATIIRRSFHTVAKEFNLSTENAPTHPAFITTEQVAAHIRKGARFFTCILDNRMIGCCAIEKSPKDNTKYYLERVAVLPEYRQRGIGAALLAHAFDQVRQSGGKTISIAIMAESTILRNWYEKFGFQAVEQRSYDHLPFQVLFLEKTL